MEELGVDVLCVVKSLHVLGIVHVLTEGKSLLEVDLLVAGTHVFHDANLGWDLATGRPSSGQEGSDVGLVHIGVVVRSVLDTIGVVVGWVVEVVVVGKHSLLDRCDLSGLALDLPLGDLFCG